MTTISHMPEKHRSEDFSMAYIQAVAAKAGANIWVTLRHDYGIDLMFTTIHSYQTLSKKRGKRYTEPKSIPLPCQVKSSKQWEFHEDRIVYDLEAQAYDDLVCNDFCFLILMCLPPTMQEWLYQDEQHLRLHHCCYYWEPSEEQVLTPNDYTKRISIPRTQQFTAEALIELLNARQRGLHP